MYGRGRFRGRLDQPGDQEAPRRVLQKICGKFRRRKRNPARIGFAETRPLRDSNALPPRLGNLTRIFNRKLKLHFTSNGGL